MAKMKAIQMVYDREGSTLNVWFDDPSKGISLANRSARATAAARALPF